MVLLLLLETIGLSSMAHCSLNKPAVAVHNKSVDMSVKFKHTHTQRREEWRRSEKEKQTMNR